MKTIKSKIISFATLLTATFLLTTGCSKSNETTTVTLGVVGTVYEEIWAPAKEALKAQGINLKFVQFTDYVTPNNALANGEIDLNGFQHRIFLENEIKNHGYDIRLIGNTFLTPMNLYSNKVKAVSELKSGSVIAIPNDVTNGGRALKVLEAAGLIKISDDAGFNPTVADITESNGIEIRELAANTIPSVLSDVDAAIINGNYALDFGLKTEEAIFADPINEEPYWNLVAARNSDLEDPAKVELYKKIVKAFQSEGTEKVFNETYGGYYIKAGWGIDEL